MAVFLRAALIGIVGMGACCFLPGCGRSSSDAEATNSTSPKASSDPAHEAIARAAADFLDAVLKGDSQRASARLTPQAIQRIVESGMPFAPPGLETATFKIGAVRTPSPDQAVVQCMLTDSSAANGSQSEEICCLLRRVESDWRVSGIAYGTTPDMPWTLSDFETGKSTQIPRQPSMPSDGMFASPDGGQGGRPSPRTASELPAAATR